MKWALVMTPAFTTTSGSWDQTRINPLPAFSSGICLTDVSYPVHLFSIFKSQPGKDARLNSMCKVVGFARALQTRDLFCHFSPSSLSPLGSPIATGRTRERRVSLGSPEPWHVVARARWPLAPGPAEPRGAPAARTCFALNGAGAAGGLFRPRPRAVAGGGSADAPYTAGPGSPGPGPGAPSLGTAGPGPRRARRPNMGTAGAAFLGAGRCLHPPG